VRALFTATATATIAEAALRLPDGTGIARWALTTTVEVQAGETLPVAPRVTVTGDCDKDYVARLMVGGGGTYVPKLALGSGTRANDANPALSSAHDNDHGLGPVIVTPTKSSDGVYDMPIIFTARDTDSSGLVAGEIAIVGLQRKVFTTPTALHSGESVGVTGRVTIAAGA
jgi:hypothetical protein